MLIPARLSRRDPTVEARAMLSMWSDVLRAQREDRFADRHFASSCGPFRPSLRSFCRPACREQPGTRENSRPRAPRCFRGISRLFRAVRTSNENRGGRGWSPRTRVVWPGVGGFVGGRRRSAHLQDGDPGVWRLLSAKCLRPASSRPLPNASPESSTQLTFPPGSACRVPHSTVTGRSTASLKAMSTQLPA